MNDADAILRALVAALPTCCGPWRVEPAPREHDPHNEFVFRTCGRPATQFLVNGEHEHDASCDACVVAVRGTVADDFHDLRHALVLRAALAYLAR